MMTNNNQAFNPKLKDFQLVKTLGTGTFGRVYLTHHLNGKYFAMKVLKKLEIIRLKQGNLDLTLGNCYLFR
jgi:serine/threonine protein kinase